MSALPAAVQKQVEEANKLVEAIYPTVPNPDEGEPVVAAVEPAPEPPVEEPPVEEPAVVEAVVAPEPEPDPDPDSETWQHKYKVLQGKYNAEVPRLIQQGKEQETVLRDMRQQLTNTQTAVTSLSQGTAVPQGEVVAPVTPPRRLVKDDEIHQFGADLHDFIKRTALEQLPPGVNDLLAKLEQRVTATEQTAKDAVAIAGNNAEEKVIALLDSKVQGWETQNRDQAFLSWLDEVDPYAGRPRGELLSQAYTAHDGPRVVALFMGFRNENAALTPPTPEPAAPAVVVPIVEEPTAPEGPGLEGLVAPGTPKTGAQGGAPDDAGKRVWTQPAVTELYAKINEYTKKGKDVPKNLRAQEANLIRAQAEGRIQT